MNDIFATLTSGAKFDKKKHGATLEAFAVSNRTQNKLKLDLFSPDLKENEDTVYIKKPTADSEIEERDEEPVNEETFSNQEAVNAFRNRLQIKVKGDNLVNPCATFYTMDIQKDVKPVIIKNIELTDWKEPTPIQMQAIPCLLAGRDVLAAAPTGSGKTASFVIPVLSRLGQTQRSKTKDGKVTGGGVRALLLAPTRELAEQIYREASRLIVGRKIKICLLKKNVAADAMLKQEKTYFDRFDLIVATPLRLLSLVRAEVIDLSRVQMIVLDEADKLFELDSYSRNQQNEESAEDEEGDGAEVTDEQATRIRTSFLSQVDEILSTCPKNSVQRALFSATIGPFVEDLSHSFLSDPIQITIGKQNAGASTIDQKLVFVGREDGKLLAIRQIVQQGLKPPVLLFLQSIDRAKELYRELIFDGINVDVMHAERTQLQREDIITRFRMGKIWVLICTDLMARGIDFKGVQMVINYDLPQSAVSYIHRIGRTGRAGRTGTAITLFTEDDMPRLRPIANVIKLSGCPVPDWMMTIKQQSTRNKKQLRRKAPVRRHIDTGIFVPKKRDAATGEGGDGKHSKGSKSKDMSKDKSKRKNKDSSLNHSDKKSRLK